MDICVLNPYFHPQYGGTEHVLFEIYKRAAKRHNITVLTSSLNSGARTVDHIYGMKVVRMETRPHNIPGLPLPLLEMKGIGEEIARAGADIYHINNRYQYFNWTVKAIKQTGKKLAITIHNALPIGIDFSTDTVGLLYDAVWGRKIMMQSDLITAVSRNTMLTTVPKNCLDKTHVIPNGVDFERFRPRPGDRKARAIRERAGSGKLVLNTARLVRQKGQVYLIRALAKLNKGNADGNCGLMIIGSGPLRGLLKSEAKAQGLDNACTLAEGIQDNDLPYYYNAADVYAMPSLYEPSGLAVLEAMASGTPVVASSIGGLPEIIRDGGRYVTPRNVEGLAAEIKLLMDNKKLASRLSRNARNIVVKHHDWDRIAREYERRFEETIRS